MQTKVTWVLKRANMSTGMGESKLIVSMPDFQNNETAKSIWNELNNTLSSIEGIYYYKHPIIGSQTGIPADFCLLPKDFQPIAIRCLDYNIEDISEIKDESWVVNGETKDSPLAELDDFVTALDSKFKKERELRRAVDPISAIILPNITKIQFQTKFPKTKLKVTENCFVIWKGESFNQLFQAIKFSDTQWQLAQAIFQSTTPLNRKVITDGQTSTQIGEAIKLLDRRIAILDEVQHRTTVQIPPGPQRIRGLAGTGKTILLAMRAAFLHQRFPDAKILFTFHTQSLYNQAKTLITKFYRENIETDPNWENLHIRHGWGGSQKSGVYWDACKRIGVFPLNFAQAKIMGGVHPLGVACDLLLKEKLEPVYDYILVDEAQDFPKEFFRVLYKLSKPPHCIYWAYDELQSLSSVAIPTPIECFGNDTHGKPLVSLDGEYSGGMEKDVVLNRSYRCPIDILMLAHAIGLGIYSSKGCVQMIPDQATWKALGYELESGKIKTGNDVVFVRPAENSPNKIHTIYTGTEDVIQVMKHETRDDEINAVAKSIINLIANEKVLPQNIVVVSLDSKHARDHLSDIQVKLLNGHVESVVPGLVDASSEFGEIDKVTLSTVYRAKGNEAPIVFIICFDAIYDYVDEVENRNKAFTSISRAKGWVKISGCGTKMVRAQTEIAKIRKDIPNFKFKFPSLDKIKCLGHAETARRRREHHKISDTVAQILHADDDVLQSLNPAQLEELLIKLKNAKK